MSETAPAAAPDAPAPGAKAAAKKPKKAAGGSKARKPSGPSVTELITKAVSASKERKGLSLAALKKALAAGGYDVEKNNSRIKLGLKSLVNKGTLVQTKGIGASGSFLYSKKVHLPVQQKVLEKKLEAKKPASVPERLPEATPPPTPTINGRCPKGAKKPTTAAAKSPKKVARPRKEAQNSAKPKRTKAKAKHTAPKEKVKQLESNIVPGKNPRGPFRATCLNHKGVVSNSHPIFIEKRHPIWPEMLEK
nr:histone H1.01-like isoform X1 [Dromaius novaehollandiae]XP_025977156.1 histone H1.01-like isoform X2 [Dromaius novaehollandiae]